MLKKEKRWDAEEGKKNSGMLKKEKRLAISQWDAEEEENI